MWLAAAKPETTRRPLTAAFSCHQRQTPPHNQTLSIQSYFLHQPTTAATIRKMWANPFWACVCRWSGQRQESLPVDSLPVYTSRLKSQEDASSLSQSITHFLLPSLSSRGGGTTTLPCASLGISLVMFPSKADRVTTPGLEYLIGCRVSLPLISALIQECTGAYRIVFLVLSIQEISCCIYISWSRYIL